MSLYVLSHLWEVNDVEDGISVRLTHRDMDAQTLSILADELSELALESGRPTLYLDFGELNFLTSVVIGKLFAVERRLREAGGLLVLIDLDPTLREVFEAMSWPADAIRE
jgi:anti-anti-sigma factor